MNGQDPSQKQLEFLQKAESCVICLPSLSSSCCRTQQGSKSSNDCTQQCQPYGTNTRLFDGSNCFCFDTQPTCDQLETNTQQCKKGEKKNCFTGTPLQKQVDKKATCEESCKKYGIDHAMVCKDKCYCVPQPIITEHFSQNNLTLGLKGPMLRTTTNQPQPSIGPKGPIREFYTLYNTDCPTGGCTGSAQPICPTSDCPAMYQCATAPNNVTCASYGPSADVGTPFNFSDEVLQNLRCNCDNEIKSAPTDSTADVLALWSTAVNDAKSCNGSVLTKFKEKIETADKDQFETNLAKHMCTYTNMTNPRSPPPAPSVGSTGWFLSSVTNPIVYGFSIAIIYIFYAVILVCTFYPRGVPIGTNPFEYSVFNSFWFKDLGGKKDIVSAIFIFLVLIILLPLSAITNINAVGVLLQSGFGNGLGWFLILPLLAVLLGIGRFVSFLAPISQAISTIVMLFVSAIVIVINLTIAYLTPSLAIIFLIVYRLISSGVSKVNTIAPVSTRTAILSALEWLTGITPADRWVIPFMPILGMIAKVFHMIAGTASLPKYFERATLGTIVGCADTNLFLS